MSHMQTVNPEVLATPVREISLRLYADGVFIAYDKESGHNLARIAGIDIHQHVDALGVTRFTVSLISLDQIEHVDIPYYVQEKVGEGSQCQA